jgi:hypothetical protein
MLFFSKSPVFGPGAESPNTVPIRRQSEVFPPNGLLVRQNAVKISALRQESSSDPFLSSL